MASSRPYKITAKAPVGRTIIAEDHVETKLDIPPVLPPEQQTQVLENLLQERGFRSDSDGNLTRDRNGVKVTVDPIKESMRVSVEVEKDLPPPDNPSPCSCRAMEAVRQAERQESDLQRAATERLEGALGRLGCEIEGVINKVVKEGLKIKAAQMGEVLSIDEDAKTGSMTILVEV